MKSKKTILALPLFLLVVSFCGNDLAVREILTRGTFEAGFIEGQIFTNKREIMIQVMGDSVPELDLDAEIQAGWDEYGIMQVAGLCDSLGVVLDGALQNGLRTVYSRAFRYGVSAEHVYTVEDSLEGSGNPALMAQGVFEAEKEIFLGYLDGIEIKYKPDSGNRPFSESVN